MFPALTHYIFRIKIFTRGKEQFTTSKSALRKTLHSDAARTIKPSGAITDLKKDSIFDRELLQTKGLKVRGKSFALPNVEVGDIIEYQYKEIRDNEIAQYQRLYFQREIPTWTVTYHLKPLQIPYLPYAMRTIAFHYNITAPWKEPNGFYSTTMTNMGGFKPNPTCRRGSASRLALLYYEEDKKSAQTAWKSRPSRCTRFSR
jgi:hypothetical protein